jgi:hypothetical protein
MDNTKTMALTESSICAKALRALAAVKRFIEAEHSSALANGMESTWTSNIHWIEIAHEILARCDEPEVRTLLDDMRGLSHHFGAYCSDQNKLDRLLDDLYAGAQDAVLQLRQNP